MKKLAIGCGVVILLVGVAGAVASYYLYRQIGGAVAQLSEFAQVPDLERGVTNQQTFTPPASGDLTREQVERLVRVQGLIREHLGTSIAAMESRYKTLLEREQATVRDLPQLIGVYRDLAGTWMEAKRRQVAALNETGFSLDEYRWVRDRAYAALDIPFVDVDVSRLIEGIDSGRPPEEVTRPQTGEPDRSPVNEGLVGAFRRQLEENVALAALGL
jgi:hypothetical protein